jgi:hypothetical protein
MDNLLPTVATSNPTERNIAAIAKLKHDALGRRTPTERVSELVTKLVGNIEWPASLTGARIWGFKLTYLRRKPCG